VGRLQIDLDRSDRRDRWMGQSQGVADNFRGRWWGGGQKSGVRAEFRPPGCRCLPPSAEAQQLRALYTPDEVRFAASQRDARAA